MVVKGEAKNKTPEIMGFVTFNPIKLKNKASSIIVLITKTFKKYQPEEYRPGAHITNDEELVKIGAAQ